MISKFKAPKERKEPKQPKEPKTFRYPRMYMLDVFAMGTRLRIIYPDGRVEVSGPLTDIIGTFKEARVRSLYNYGKGCWNIGFISGAEAVKAMKAYDAEDYPYKMPQTTIFIGEIR